MNPSLRRHQRDWEDLGDLDPCWAILAFPERRYGRWDLDEFFRSGEQEIAGLAVDMQRLGYPARRERALDFGCGVGRLTRALATHFWHCYGLDVAAPMIAAARKLNATYPNCEFVLNDNPDLGMFPDGHFDLIYSVLVLQHLPTRAAIGAHLADFARVLAPGGLLVCQIPSHIPRALLTEAGGQVLEARADTMASTAIESRTYYVTKPEGRANVMPSDAV